MQFNVRYEESNDSLPFIANDNKDILIYYINHLNSKKENKFRINKNLGTSPEKLISFLSRVNQYFKLYTGETFEICSNEEYFNQSILNKLHAKWVHAQTISVNVKKHNLAKYYSDNTTFINLDDILSKTNKRIEFNEVNTLIHKFESQFNNINYQTFNYFNIKNPFPKNRCTNDIANFRISFSDLGRSLYNKFLYLDDNLEYDDESTFDDLKGCVDISLKRPETIPLSKEYTDWCNRRKKVPSGKFINLGNLVDFENRLTEYRQIVYSNRNNSFKIEIKE